MGRVAIRLARAAVFLGIAIAPLVARAGACEDLPVSLDVTDTEITLAQSVPGGAFAAPDGATYGSLPAFCRVAGVSHPTKQSSIGFEVWLPTDSRNQKFQGVGNGGLAGAVLYAPLALALQQGYATAATDDGHAGSSPLWLGNYEQLVDFGTRAVHTTTWIGKRIVRAFYGERPTASYFVGCSEGGREALIEAQRFPGDYDGIIAGDSFLFLAPGVGHCNGGPGPNAFGISGQPPVPYDDRHSLIAALDRWVTRGVPPSRIIATKFVNDDPSQGIATTRPLCPYPQVAIYAGHGDTNSAGNFRCGDRSDED